MLDIFQEFSNFSGCSRPKEVSFTRKIGWRVKKICRVGRLRVKIFLNLIYFKHKQKYNEKAENMDSLKHVQFNFSC